MRGESGGARGQSQCRSNNRISSGILIQQRAIVGRDLRTGLRRCGVNKTRFT